MYRALPYLAREMCGIVSVLLSKRRTFNTKLCLDIELYWDPFSFSCLYSDLKSYNATFQFYV